MTFEQTMGRLDEITRKLQNSETGLTEAIDLFEEGMKLAKEADTQLSSAERRIEQVVGAPSADELVTEPFSAPERS